jgi:4a-hydroxytetrahydrobiopterin dehydratase
MPDLLSDGEIDKALKGMDGWSHDDVYHRLFKDFSFDKFASAVTFVNRVAEIAEEMNHHPDILIFDYSNVKITTTTHDANGITNKDIALTESIEILVSG